MTTPQYDFYSPFMSAAILTRDGEKIPLWTNTEIGSDPGSTASAKTALKNSKLYSLPFLNELTVETNLSSLPIITAVLTPPFQDAINLLDSPLVEWGVSEIQVQFGYTGGTLNNAVLSPVYSGLLLKPAINIGIDTTITFYGQGGFSLIWQERNDHSSGPTTRRKEIVKILSEGPDKKNPRKFNPVFTEADKDPVAFGKLDESLESVSADHQNDWDRLFLLANECMCWPLVIGNDVILKPRISALNATPTKTFILYNSGAKLGLVGDKYQYPILTFSTPTTAIYLPGMTRAMIMNGVNSADRKPNQDKKSTISATTATTDSGGSAHKDSSSTPGIDQNTNDGASNVYSPPEDSRLRDAFEAEFERQHVQFGIEIDVETLGIPDLLPGEVISVKGVGGRIDGNFLVFSVTHTLGVNGYTTRFTAFTNAPAISEKFAKPFDTTPNIKDVNPQRGVVAIADPQDRHFT